MRGTLRVNGPQKNFLGSSTSTVENYSNKEMNVRDYYQVSGVHLDDDRWSSWS